VLARFGRKDLTVLKLRIFTLGLMMTFGLATMAQANDITIWDNHGTCTPVGAKCEDNETEPGTIQSQVWDLEAFLLNGNILSMVGGFDFNNGVIYAGNPYKSGDIFLDVTGDALYGTSTPPLGGPVTGSGSYSNPYVGGNSAGWDYAIRLTFSGASGGSYAVYAINSSTRVIAPTDIDIPSQPWKVQTLPTTAVAGGSFSLTSFTGGSYLGWGINNTHYQLDGIDLGDFVASGTDFTAHFTMQCGNDNLIGRASVPEPTSLVLLGLGLMGVAIRARKSRQN
jgi:hypothetical protein